MNKLLIFPLSFLLLITIFAALFSNSTSDSNTTVTVNGTTTNVAIPGGGSRNFNIWTSPTSVLAIIVAAMVLGAITGLHFLGSGLTDFSQKIIFNAVLFLGLWACLSLITSFVIFSSTIFAMFWMILTVMYSIGLGGHISSGE
jgi:hypothetical protein